MKLLIISFESQEQCLIKRFTKSLNPNDFILVNMLDYRDSNNEYHLPQDLCEQIKNFNPDKLYLSAHGLHHDVKHCYYLDFHQNKCIKAASAENVAQVVSQLYTPEIGKILPVELIICFGARSSNYQLNHIEETDNINWLDSFAYRLFLHLTNLKIVTQMKSYLMAIQIVKGVVQCDDESSISIREQINNIVIKADELWTAISALQDKIDTDEFSPESENEIDALTQQHYATLLQKDRLDDKLIKGCRANQGAICYSLNSNTLNISMELPHKVLYNGEYIAQEDDIVNLNPVSNKSCVLL